MSTNGLESVTKTAEELIAHIEQRYSSLFAVSKEAMPPANRVTAACTFITKMKALTARLSNATDSAQARLKKFAEVQGLPLPTDCSV
ncbi:hypothetical protein C4571_02650 [Candidatus Parcubacteria bacterium]|nr:MAG: hypothetical protein C4571_02650 [Candidatus Parcubacteria bacterium]